MINLQMSSLNIGKLIFVVEKLHVLSSGLIIESILINDKITQPLGGRLNDFI